MQRKDSKEILSQMLYMVDMALPKMVEGEMTGTVLYFKNSDNKMWSFLSGEWWSFDEDLPPDLISAERGAYALYAAEACLDYINEHCMDIVARLQYAIEHSELLKSMLDMLNTNIEYDPSFKLPPMDVLFVAEPTKQAYSFESGKWRAVHSINTFTMCSASSQHGTIYASKHSMGLMEYHRKNLMGQLVDYIHQTAAGDVRPEMFLHDFGVSLELRVQSYMFVVPVDTKECYGFNGQSWTRVPYIEEELMQYCSYHGYYFNIFCVKSFQRPQDMQAVIDSFIDFYNGGR